MSLVLASGSASRRAMLDAAGIIHEAMPARIDERGVEATMQDADAAAIATGLSIAKAQAVSAGEAGRTVLGSDSLVLVEGRRFDKPGASAQAAEHLRFFSGKVMELHSAAALVRDGETLWTGHDCARLHVRHLDDSFIDTYLAAEWPAVSGCVGVFRIEGAGTHLFTAIDGDHHTILGMPLLKVLDALRTHCPEAGALLR